MWCSAAVVECPLTWPRRYSHRLSRQLGLCSRRCHPGGRYTPSNPSTSRCWIPPPWRLCVLRQTGRMSLGPIRALTTRPWGRRRRGHFRGRKESIGLEHQVITDEEHHELSSLQKTHHVFGYVFPASTTRRGQAGTKCIISRLVLFWHTSKRRRRMMPCARLSGPCKLIYNVINVLAGISVVA